jgi:hypothetical protein
LGMELPTLHFPVSSVYISFGLNLCCFDSGCRLKSYSLSIFFSIGLLAFLWRRRQPLEMMETALSYYLAKRRQFIHALRRASLQ